MDSGLCCELRQELWRSICCDQDFDSNCVKAVCRGAGRGQINAPTVDEALKDLTEQFPGLKKHLYNESGALRNFVNIYLNDEDVRYLEKGGRQVGEARHLSDHPGHRGRAPAASTAPARP